MTTDRELLRRYTREGAEPAFAEIVRRHVNLVYGTALRQLCGNTTLARDATQAVFTTLAASVRKLSAMENLAGWLYTTTCFTVSHTVRAERRRQEREIKAHVMHQVAMESEADQPPEPPPGMVDAVLEQLDASEREVVLLRFFEGCSFADIGAAADCSEDAARMRLSRALEKIRSDFARRGVRSSAVAISNALTSHVVAAPADLATNVSTTTLVGAAAAAGATGASFGALTFMLTSKSAVGLAAAATVLLLAFFYVSHREARLDRNETAHVSPEPAAASLHPAEAIPPPVEMPARAAETAPQQTLAQKMALMKPHLEAGMPIKGVVVVLENGQPVQKLVEFVMGKETRIDAAGEGTYVITPALNEDGTVRYAVAMHRANARGENQWMSFPTVIQTPWAGFTVATDQGQVLGFDPDLSEP